MKHRHVILDGTAKRSTNLLTTAIAEFTSGWTLDATGGTSAGSARSTVVSSPFNGDVTAPASAWGYAWYYIPGTNGSGSQPWFSTTASPGTFGTAKMTVFSIYVAGHIDGATATNRILKINIQGQTGATEQSATFSRTTTPARYTVSAEAGGAVGRVDQVCLPVNLATQSAGGTMSPYDEVWTRLTVCYAPGWLDAAGVATASASGDSLKIVVTTEDNASGARSLNVWGAHLSQPTTPWSAVDHATLVRYVRDSYTPPEYMVGTKPIHNGVAPRSDIGHHPFNAFADLSEVQSGTYTTWMLNTADAGLRLWGRSHPAAPWEKLTDTVEGGLTGGVLTGAVSVLRPEMRLCISELNNDTTTLGYTLF